MSYFDTIRCSACGNAFDPEKVAVTGGQVVCPACGEVLKLTDLFGLADQFAEEDVPDLTLDDLVPGGRGGTGRAAGPPAAGETLPVLKGGALDVARTLKKDRG